MARELHPGKRNSLDALCERYAVSNAHRTLHGALLDAGLLAEVYLAMTRGQDALVIDLAPAGGLEDAGPIDTSGLILLAATPDELLAHEKLLDGIAKDSKGRVVFRPPPQPALPAAS
jgi:DNA polymerase-3 subunit epsilon